MNLCDTHRYWTLKLSDCPVCKDIELGGKLETSNAEIERLQLQAQDHRAQIDSLQSRLQECQKYWDDEKRRYDAADKGFRLVCDERDSLSRRLGVYLNQLRVGVEVVQHDPHGGATANWLAAVRELLAGCRNCGAATTALTNGWCDACMGITVVERQNTK